MIKSVIGLIFALVFSTNFFGQSITVSYPQKDSSIASPYAPTNEYSYCQTIYWQYEIQGNGFITGLTYYYPDTSLKNSDFLEIYMGKTDLDAMDSAYIVKRSLMKRVFNGLVTGYTIPGQVTITLDTPFYYSGDSNLIISVNEKKAGWEDNYYNGWFTGYFPLYGRHTRSTCLETSWSPWNLNLLESTSPYTYPPTDVRGIAKITFQGLTPLPCQSPQNVRFTHIGYRSAQMEWQPPGSGNAPTGYEVYYSTTRYKPMSFSTPNFTIVADTQIIIGSLAPATRYYGWVRSKSGTAVCISGWTIVDSFTTLCTPQSVPTVAEQFDGNFIPSCWNGAIGTFGAPTQFERFDTNYLSVQKWKRRLYRNQSGSNYAAEMTFVDSNTRHWLMTPLYDLGTSNSLLLEFDLALTKNYSTAQGYLQPDDKFYVVMSPDSGVTWRGLYTLGTWVYPQFIPNTGSHVTIPLTGYNGLVRIGFYAQSTAENSVANVTNLFVDNVKISVVQPVKLLEFVGIKEGATNLLKWRTATEQNNRGFELQRSASGTTFSTLAFVLSKAAGGNSTGELSYQYTDKKPFAAGSYYRLKQVDFDGKFTCSNVVFIKGDPVTELVLTSLFPNPTNQLLNVVLQAPAAQRVQIVIADLAGKILQQQTLQLAKGTNNKMVNVAQLAKGTYVVKVVCANGCEAAVSKFVKE